MIRHELLPSGGHPDGRLQVAKDRYSIGDIRCGGAAHRRKTVAEPRPVATYARAWNARIAVCDCFRRRVAPPERHV
ncbi:MAG: hypothetical protein RIB84_20605 [Sneathiellaceae bacterium]